MGKTIWSHLPHLARISNVCAYFDANFHGGKKNVFYSYNTNFDFYGIPCVVIIQRNETFFLENVNEPDIYRQGKIL